MTRHQDPQGVLAWVEEKISTVTHLPVANGEVYSIQYVPNKKLSNLPPHKYFFDSTSNFIL